jgi:fibronectin type 3 domain-containing protein
LVATEPSKADVSLSWAAVPGGLPLASYNVYRGSSESNLKLLKVVTATSAATTDTTVSPGATYYYGIQAKDTDGDISPMSAIVSITASH